MKKTPIKLSDFLDELDKHISETLKKFRSISQTTGEENPALTESMMSFFTRLHKLKSYFSENRKNLQTAEKAGDNRYELLYRSSLLFSAPMETSALLALGTDTILEMVGANRGFIALVNADGGYRLISARNGQKESIEKPEEEVSDTVIQEALKAQKNIHLDAGDFNESLLAKSSIMRTGAASLICTPVLIDQQIKGIVYVDQFANDFPPATAFGLIKSFSNQLANFIKNSEAFTALQDDNAQLLAALNKQYQFGNIIAKSAAMTRVLKTVAKVADKDVAVLIQGETGTGKDLIARALHQNSQRKDNAFVEVDCGALPPKLIESELFGYVKGAFTGAQADKVGLLKSAEGGTIFLDEINNLSLEVQGKLLRALQQKKVRPIGSTKEEAVDFRLISAANVDLKKSVADGLFREDLFYRINTISLVLPPLRDRQADILALAEHFLKRYSQIHNSAAKGFSPQYTQAILGYEWRGNIRELEHVIERSIILSENPTLSIDDLPPEFHGNDAAIPDENTSLTMEAYVNLCKKQYTEKVLAECNGNKAETARRLNLHRTYLFDLIKKLNIKDGQGLK